MRDKDIKCWTSETKFWTEGTTSGLHGQTGGCEGLEGYSMDYIDRIKYIVARRDLKCVMGPYITV